MDKESLVSVIITTYNCAPFVEETIASAIAQTYVNKEIIIVDDGSDDDTVDNIINIIKKHREIHFYQLKHTGSPAKVRNHGIAKAKGKYIAFLDGDDLWVKHKLTLQVKKLEEDKSCVLTYSMSVTIGEVDYFSPYFEVLPLLNNGARTRDELIRGNTITNSSVLVRTEILKQFGGYDEDPQLKVEDYDLWLRLGEMGNYLFIPRVLVYYRIHKSQFSGNWEIRQKRLKYLAEKRNLPIPAYMYYRNKNIVVRIARNSLHMLNYFIAKSYEIIDDLRGGK